MSLHAFSPQWRRTLASLPVLLILSLLQPSSKTLVAQDVSSGLLGGLLALSADFFSEGDKTFGAGEVITVSGVVPYLPWCPSLKGVDGRGEGRFDFFPVADLYVIADTGLYIVPFLEELEDASGAANRVTGTGTGAFVDEVVAIAQPAGTLPAGRYDIVMDQCLDGRFDPGFDLILGAGPGYAFEVVIPGLLPKMDLHPLKEKAGLYAGFWSGATIELPDVGIPTEPIEVPGFCPLFEKVIKKVNIDPLEPISAAAKIAILHCANLSAHWNGIAHDPPDANFTQFAELGDLGYEFRTDTRPLTAAMSRLAHVMADQAAQSRALLTTLERMQGAQLAGDDEYLVLQLEEANKLVNMQIGPGGSLLRLYAAMEAFDLALEDDPWGTLQEAAELRAFIPEMRQAIGGLVGALGPEFLRKKTQTADLIVPKGFQAWLIVYLGLEPLLATEGLPGVLQVRDASGLPPITFQHPTTRTTGAYLTAPGRAVTLDATGSIDPNGDPLFFAWDLDGDGAFDDAAAALATHVFNEPGTRLVGVKVSDAAGHTDVHHTLVKVGDTDSQDVVGAARGEFYRVRPDGSVDVVVPSVGRGTLSALHVDLNGDIVVLTARSDTGPIALRRYDAAGTLLSEIPITEVAALIDLPLLTIRDFVIDGRGDLLLTATENIPGPVRAIGAGFNGVAPSAEGRGLLIRLAKDGSRATIIAFVHQEYVSREIVNGELVVVYTSHFNGSRDAALAIAPDGGIVVAPANNLVTDRLAGIFKYDPDTGASAAISPGGRIEGTAQVEFYYPHFGGTFCGTVAGNRNQGGIEIDVQGNIITGHGTGPCFMHLYRVPVPLRLSTLFGFENFHGVEIVPLLSVVSGAPTIGVHDAAMDRGGDALVGGTDWTAQLPAGIYRVSPAGELFVHAAIPGGVAVLDVVPDERPVTIKDIPAPPAIGLMDLSVNQQTCPGNAELQVSVVNRGTGSLDTPSRVYFYDGDPLADGTLVGSAVTTAPIAAGWSVTVSAPWTGPVPGGHEVFAVTLGAAQAVSRSVFVCVPASPNGPDAILLEPRAASAAVGASHEVTAILRDVLDRPAAGVPITFAVTGANAEGGVSLTDDEGTARFTYIGTRVGLDRIAATSTNAVTSNDANHEWLPAPDGTPPALTVPADIVEGASGPSGAVVSFVASATDLVDGTVPVTCAPASGSVFPIGATTVTCSATDLTGNTATARFVVTIRAATPPEVPTFTASPGELWPPNHRMVTVTLLPIPANTTATCTIATVTSSDPVDGRGDGTSSPDWLSYGPLTLGLRAERSSDHVGRVYTVGIVCLDTAGRPATREVTVVVPRDRGR